MSKIIVIFLSPRNKVDDCSIDRTLPRFCRLQDSLVTISKVRSPLVNVAFDAMINVSPSFDHFAVVIRGEYGF